MEGGSMEGSNFLSPEAYTQYIIVAGSKYNSAQLYDCGRPSHILLYILTVAGLHIDFCTSSMPIPGIQNSRQHILASKRPTYHLIHAKAQDTPKTTAGRTRTKLISSTRSLTNAGARLIHTTNTIYTVPSRAMTNMNMDNVFSTRSLTINEITEESAPHKQKQTIFPMGLSSQATKHQYSPSLPC